MTTAGKSGERSRNRPGSQVRFTVSQYDHMIETGELIGIEGRKLQLVRGEVVYMSPSTARHDDVVYVLTTWAYTNVDEIGIPVDVSIQLSINLPDQSSVLSPDMAFVVKQSYATRRPVPADVYLLIEVLDKSTVQNADEKRALYAEANIAEYWAIDVPNRAVIIHRDPSEGVYRDIQSHSEQESIEPSVLQGISLPIETLFRSM